MCPSSFTKKNLFKNDLIHKLRKNMYTYIYSLSILRALHKPHHVCLNNNVQTAAAMKLDT
jgi:hypothetical protein